MKLDNEQQRQILIQLINSMPINGNLQQVTQTANVMVGLLQAVERAGIEEPLNDSGISPEMPQPRK